MGVHGSDGTEVVVEGRGEQEEPAGDRSQGRGEVGDIYKRKTRETSMHTWEHLGNGYRAWEYMERSRGSWGENIQ